MEDDFKKKLQKIEETDQSNEFSNYLLEPVCQKTYSTDDVMTPNLIRQMTELELDDEQSDISVHSSKSNYDKGENPEEITNDSNHQRNVGNYEEAESQKELDKAESLDQQNDECSVAGKRRWSFVRENLERVLEYGRREGIIERKNIFINPNLGATNSTGKGQLDNDDELEREAKKELSFIHSAIPYLPLAPAIICCTANILLPGLGTALSGIFSLCFGKCRIQIKEFRKGATLLVNFAVGIGQLNTVAFFFVGWFWSIAWGGSMMMFAMQYRHVNKKKRKVLIATAAIEALTNNDLRRRQNVSNLLTMNRSKQPNVAKSTENETNVSAENNV